MKNVLSYLKSIQSNLVAFYDLHSYGQNVLYPWAFSSVLAPDAFELVSLIIFYGILHFSLQLFTRVPVRTLGKGT